MRSFRHLVPQLRLFQGSASLDLLDRELDRVNSRRAMIFCGSSLGRAGSPLDLVLSAAGERCVGVFAQVRAQSPLPSVEEAARELRRLRADAVIAVGGGSAIVTARAASILLAEGGDARRLCTTHEHGRLDSPRLLAAKLPQLVVPTTPTTATVKAGAALFDPQAGQRLALYDPKTRASAVFIHPVLIASPPRELVISAGLNTLALAVEGLMSRSGDPISDALLMHAVRLFAQHLPQAARSDDDGSTRAELMLASVLCGQGSDHTAAGIAIPLGHAISARFHIDHGITNAIVLPHVLRFNADAAMVGLGKLAAALGPPPTGDLPKGAITVVAAIDAIDAIFGALGLPRRLRDVGVPRESLLELATVAMGDWYLQGNPRPVQDASELQQVLEAAW